MLIKLALILIYLVEHEFHQLAECLLVGVPPSAIGGLEIDLRQVEAGGVRGKAAQELSNEAQGNSLVERGFVAKVAAVRAELSRLQDVRIEAYPERIDGATVFQMVQDDSVHQVCAFVTAVAL